MEEDKKKGRRVGNFICSDKSLLTSRPSSQLLRLRLEVDKAGCWLPACRLPGWAGWQLDFEPANCLRHRIATQDGSGRERAGARTVVCVALLRFTIYAPFWRCGTRALGDSSSAMLLSPQAHTQGAGCSGGAGTRSLVSVMH